MDNPTLVTLDFESYFDKDCTFGKLSTPEYVHHPDFKVHMVGIKIDDGDIAIVEEHNIKETLEYLSATYSNIHLIAQNTAFDGYVLSALYDWRPSKYIDTMGMSRGQNPHSSASLKNIAMRLFPLNEKLRKGEALAATKGVRDLREAGIFDDTAEYCKQDVALTYIIYKHLKKVSTDHEMDMMDLLLRMFCIPILELDLELLERYLFRLETVREETIAKGGVSGDILRSNKKLEAYFLKQLNLKPPMKVSLTTGLPVPAFAKTDLELHRFQEKHPELQDLFAAKDAAKSSQASSRTQRFINIAKATGNVLPAYLAYSAAHTHRLAGGDKTNLQNLERNAAEDHPEKDLRPGVLRRAILAPKKHVVHVRDLSNIEARVLACIAGQLDMVELFRSGGDPYSELATRIYGKVVTKKLFPFERGVGKVATLGLGYGMGVDKFKDTLNAGPLGMPPIFFDEKYMYGHIVKNVYRVVNSRIVDFWRKCDTFISWMSTAKEGEVLEYKCLKVYKERILLPNGLSLHYPELKHVRGNWEYKAKNYFTKLYGGKLCENIVQALAQIVIKSNMLTIDKAFPTVRVALQVHDEIISVVPESIIETFDSFVADTMRCPPEWMPELPLDSEGGWAENYIK